MNERPYYIHCVEGKDRTGFVLAVLEGFASATYEEITSDFMKSYYNFYGFLLKNGMSQEDMKNLYDKLVDESKLK